jgi:hypothetical protein
MSRSHAFSVSGLGNVEAGNDVAVGEIAAPVEDRAIFFTAISVDEGVQRGGGPGNPFAYIVRAIGGPKKLLVAC